MECMDCMIRISYESTRNKYVTVEECIVSVLFITTNLILVSGEREKTAPDHNK